MTARPLRFGLVHSSPVGAEWPDRVREAASLGYGTLLLTDHLDGQPAPGVALGMAAAVAPGLGLGTLVYCNDLHRPALLAREALTLGHLSARPVELGIGAGWDPRDYAAAGVPFEPAATRVERLAESLDLLRRQVRGEPVEGAPVGPEPPVPPVLLVGGGGPRVLGVAGTYADVVSLNPRLDGGAFYSAANDARRQVEWVAAAGRLDRIELAATLYDVVVTGDGEAAARELARARGAEVEHVLASPHAAFGTHREIADALLRRRDELGISYVTVDEWHRDAMAPVVELVSGR